MVVNSTKKSVTKSVNDTSAKKKTKVKLGNLRGPEGNAFVILGKCRAAAKEAGWTESKIKNFNDEATASGYDHLLDIVEKYFDISYK